MRARRFGVTALARDLDIDQAVVVELARMLGIPIRSRTSSSGNSVVMGELDAAAISAEWQKQVNSNSLLHCVVTSERERRGRLAQELSEVRDRFQRHYQGPFIASSRKKHFHRLSCKWASKLRSSPEHITFFSHTEAVQRGYRPCKTCRS
jgi:hypothetical protein